VFPISSKLVARLRPLVEGRKPDEPLFVTPIRVTKKGKQIGGTRLEPDNFVKRHLTPVLRKLGLAGACHSFRHGNASALDHLKAPLRVRQDRLGHVDPKTTMLYTHTVSEDERTVAEQLGELSAGNSLPKICLNVQTAQEPKSQAVA
jgi:integrase